MVHEGHRPLETTRPPFSSPHAGIDAAFREADPPLVVLFGKPGSGKTTALKWAARESARHLVRGRRGDVPVPIYVDLGTWENKHAGCNRLGELLKRCRPKGLGRRAVIWFLDGLDLLPGIGPHAARAVLEDARKRASIGERFVFSTRPTLAVEGVLGEWGRSCRLSLLPSNTDERIVWARKHCPEAISAFTGFEQDHPQHAGLLDTPLLFGMALSASLDKELEDLKPFRWDLLPGRSGPLQGFVAYALARAVRDGRITEAERNDYEEESSGVVQGAFWAALTSGQQDRLPRANVEAYLSKAFGDVDKSLREVWKKGRDILLKAGLLHDLASESAWGVIHQQFAEYWAARHLAGRLDNAFEAAWLEAELWDHLTDMRLDPVVGLALAVVSAEKGGSERLQSARQCLTSLAVYDHAMILAETDRGSAVDVAFQAFQGEDSELRWRALHALVRIGGTSVIGRLIACLRHDTRDVRLAARVTLVGLGHELATDDQVALLKDPNPSVRIAATEALGTTKNKSAVKSLIGCLEDPDWVVQRGAADALGRLGSRSALKALVALASNPARVAAPAAAEALGGLGTCAQKPLASLLGSPSPLVRSSAATALGAMKHRQAARRLLPLLQDPHPYVRSAAAKALGKMDYEEAVEPLTRLLEDESWHVRKDAVTALGELKSDRVAEALVASLENPDGGVRYEALLALKKIRYERIDEVMTKMLKDSGPYVRVLAARSLVALESEGAVEPLVDLLKDSDDSVRREAERALGKAVEAGVVQLKTITEMAAAASYEVLQRVADWAYVRLEPPDQKEKLAGQRRKRAQQREARMAGAIATGKVSAIPLAPERIPRKATTGKGKPRRRRKKAKGPGGRRGASGAKQKRSVRKQESARLEPTTWRWPGLPGRLERLAEFLEKNGESSAGDIALGIGTRAEQPSKVIGDYRHHPRYAEWIARFIHHDTLSRTYQLKQ
ncbi:MAG: HEAT repeat domain-containing protein [Planctomycetota bacterium]